MSKMKDLWGAAIEVIAENGYGYISFTEMRPDYGIEHVTVGLDADLTRQLIEELKKALAEVEDM